MVNSFANLTHCQIRAPALLQDSGRRRQKMTWVGHSLFLCPYPGGSWTCPHVLVFWCYLFFSKGFEWNGHRKFTQQTTKHPSHENTFLGPDLSTKLMSTYPNHSLIFMCQIKPIFSTPPDLCQHIPSHPTAPSTMQQLPWTEIESPYNLSAHSFISQSEAL